MKNIVEIVSASPGWYARWRLTPEHTRARLLGTLVEALHEWLIDPDEIAGLPRRLHDLVELAEAEYAALAATPDALGLPGPAEPASTPRSISAPRAVLVPGSVSPVAPARPGVETMARGRAIIDFVAALTDSQAVAMLDALSGRSGQLWTDAFVL
jgi:dGTPase